MRRLRRGPQVTDELAQRVREALHDVDAAEALLAEADQGHAQLDVRRNAHAKLRAAFDAADAALREATEVAKRHSYRGWTEWRKQLSDLDVRKQINLLTEQDLPGILPDNSIRVVDTGMSGPDIGDLQYGESTPPGSPPTYGVDFESILHAS
jgi:hypothetical protein